MERALKTFGLPPAVFNKLADELLKIRTDRTMYDKDVQRNLQDYWSRALRGAYELYTPGAVGQENPAQCLAISRLRDSLELAVALNARVSETEPDPTGPMIVGTVSGTVALWPGRLERKGSRSRAIYSVAKGSRGQSNRPLNQRVSSSARNARRCRTTPVFWVARCR